MDLKGVAGSEKRGGVEKKRGVQRKKEGAGYLKNARRSGARRSGG